MKHVQFADYDGRVILRAYVDAIRWVRPARKRKAWFDYAGGAVIAAGSLYFAIHVIVWMTR